MADAPRGPRRLRVRGPRRRGPRRSLEEGGELERGGEGERHLPPELVRVGAIITIVASVAGLVTTGVATLFSALVARSQLAQSQQVADEKKREQAARVSYWVDTQPDGTRRVHLMNRSPDPISDSVMLFRVQLSPKDLAMVVWLESVPSVPPCSELIIPSRIMQYQPVKNWPIADQNLEPRPDPDVVWRNLVPPFMLELVGADFTDRNGIRWRRANGLLTNPGRDGWEAGPGPWLPGRVVDPQPQPQAVKSCGDPRGPGTPSE